MSCWIQITNLPYYFDEHAVLSMVREYGRVVRTEVSIDDVLRRTTGYVKFASCRHARLAAYKKDQCVIDHKAVRVFVAWYHKDTLSTIRVSGLPPRISPRELEDHCLPYGDIVNISFDEDSAEVSFRRVEYALRACQEMDGSILPNCSGGIRVALVNPDARNLKYKRQSFEYTRCEVPGTKSQRVPGTPPARSHRRSNRGPHSAKRHSQASSGHSGHSRGRAPLYGGPEPYQMHMTAQIQAQAQAQAAQQAQMRMQIQMQMQAQMQAQMEADRQRHAAEAAAVARSFPNQAPRTESENDAKDAQQELQVPKKGHKSRRSREKYYVQPPRLQALHQVPMGVPVQMQGLHQSHQPPQHSQQSRQDSARQVDSRDLELRKKDLEIQQMRTEIERMKLEQAVRQQQEQQQHSQQGQSQHSHLSLFGNAPHLPQQHPYGAPYTVQVTPPQAGVNAFPFPQPLPALNLQAMAMAANMQGPHSLPAGMPLLTTGAPAMPHLPKLLMQPMNSFLASPGVYRQQLSNPNSVGSAADGKSPSPLPGSAPLVYVPDRSMTVPPQPPMTMLTSAISASATPTYSSASGSPLASFHQSPLNLSLGTPTLPSSNSATTCSTRHPSTVDSMFQKTRSNSLSTVSSSESQSVRNLLTMAGMKMAAPSASAPQQYRVVVTDSQQQTQLQPQPVVKQQQTLMTKTEQTEQKEQWDEAKRRAGDTIYNALREQYPEKVAKITGMILALPNDEIERLLQDKEQLQARAKQLDTLLCQT